MNTFTVIVSKMMWVAAALGCVGGALLFGSAFFEKAAPAQGAAGALAACCAIIPYVAARAWDELTTERKR
jgi:hypothetical protein